MTDTLETRLERAFTAHQIADDQQRSISQFLGLLRTKDQATYEHSLRVGLLASQIAEYVHADSKALLYAGLLHDVGKALIRKDVLTKTVGFGPADKEEMDQHVIYSYRLLQGLHDFTADVVVRHHYFQKNGYPKELPPFLQPYTLGTQAVIHHYGSLLALADSYDAAAYRVNDKFGEKRKMTPKEVKEFMFGAFPHYKKLVDELFRNGIMQDEPVDLTDRQKELQIRANTYEAKRTPQEIGHCVQLALALEPLSEKPLCTTRSRDCSRHLKLEYFVSAAINVGPAFSALAQEVVSSASPYMYLFSERAQLEGKRYRGGGRINHGMIEMLTPIVAAQMLYDQERTLSIDELLVRTKDVLRATHREDVVSLVHLKKIANELCAYTDRVVEDHAAQNIYEFYEKELATSTRPVGVLHNKEMLEGFPTIKRMYQQLLAEPTKDLSDRVRDVYLDVRKDTHFELPEGGLTADMCGVAIYLLLSQHPGVEHIV